jgi:hypothetical protein
MITSLLQITVLKLLMLALAIADVCYHMKNYKKVIKD